MDRATSLATDLHPDSLKILVRLSRKGRGSSLGIAGDVELPQEEVEERLRELKRLTLVVATAARWGITVAGANYLRDRNLT